MHVAPQLIPAGLDAIEPEPAPDAPSALKVASAPSTTPEEQKTAILVAHEALIEADPRNAVRFQDVIEYMRQEITESAT